jgi:hypothetical protein
LSQHGSYGETATGNTIATIRGTAHAFYTAVAVRQVRPFAQVATRDPQSPQAICTGKQYSRCYNHLLMPVASKEREQRKYTGPNSHCITGKSNVIFIDMLLQGLGRAVFGKFLRQNLSQSSPSESNLLGHLLLPPRLPGKNAPRDFSFSPPPLVVVTGRCVRQPSCLIDLRPSFVFAVRRFRRRARCLVGPAAAAAAEVAPTTFLSFLLALRFRRRSALQCRSSVRVRLGRTVASAPTPWKEPPLSRQGASTAAVRYPPEARRQAAHCCSVYSSGAPSHKSSLLWGSSSV